MTIDIGALIQQLKDQPEHQVLVDGGYLNNDLKVIFEYYKTAEPDSEFFLEYKKLNSDYDFMSFCRYYFERLLKHEIQLSYTEDEWLQIKLT